MIKLSKLKIILFFLLTSTNVIGQQIKLLKIEGADYSRSQLWMNENLNTTKFRNGDPIPHAKNAKEWKRAGDMQRPAWCYVNFDSIKGKYFPKIYNWFAVADKRNISPVGYHIPEAEDWELAKDHLKALGWHAKKKMQNILENLCTKIPGTLDYLGNINSSDGNIIFWSRTSVDAIDAKAFWVGCKNNFLNIERRDKGDGLFVRCIAD